MDANPNNFVKYKLQDMALPLNAVCRQASNSMILKRRILCLLIFAAVLVAVVKMYQEGVHLWIMHKSPHSFFTIRSDGGINVTARRVKTILLWTPFFGTKNYISPLDTQGCPEAHCNITSDRNLLSQSDAIIFHHRDLNPQDLPSKRESWQRWVYLNHESPPNSPLSAIANLEDKFNWTIAYRLDSDILLTPLPQLRNTTLAPEKNPSQGKTRMAVWFVSNCKTPSNRETYVAQLRKVIPVDIYGDCGPKKCTPKMSKQCYNDVAKDFRFYLAFENSICKDYVTEKLYHVYDFDMVPVVFGGADYRKVAPPGSYINAMDFDSPRELGRYLLKVAKSPETYNKFFEWKEKYITTVAPYACQLCKKLHHVDEPLKVWTNLKKWWFDEAQCTRWQK